MSRARFIRYFVSLACVATLLSVTLPNATLSTARGESGGSPSPMEIFNQRILPIFQSPHPSSCVQCHLSAVDLKNYILPSAEKTFASLRDQDLINVDDPEKSPILKLIRMGEKDLDTGARLIHEKTRKAEYEAFSSWVKACCNDPRMLSLPPLSQQERARPEKPDAIIRHARKSRVVDSFVRQVWSQRKRCFPCHTPYEVDPSNPKQAAAIKTLKKFTEALDADTLERMKIFQETPEKTMAYLIEKSQRASEGEIPLINLSNPRKSLLVMKPMSKLPKKGEDGKFEKPSSSQPTSHLGGLKMFPDDVAYKSFVAWIQDYANVSGDRYTSVEELPSDNWFGSQLVLRVKDAPEDWAVGMPVQLFVHAWNKTDGAWESNPIAFTQGTVTPRRFINGALFLLAPQESDKETKWDRERAKLPRGRYLVKVYADFNHRLSDDPTLLLGEEDYQGEIELKKARWRETFRHAELVSVKRMQTKE